jgi:hypothetical protein
VPPARRISERETEPSPEIETVREKPPIQERKETEEIHNESIRVPFLDRLEKPKDEKQFAKFLEVMKDVQDTTPILDAVMHVPMYAKFFKELLSKKRSIEEPEIVTLSKECSAIIQNALPTKLDDPSSFCVPCIIGQNSFSALCDLGSSVSVIPLSVTKGMRMGDLQSTSVTLQLADRSIRKPAGILLDIPVMVGKFAYPVDFIVLDMDDRSEAVILGRPFLATAGELIDVKGAKLTLQWGREQVMFDMRHPTQLTHQPEPCNRIDTVGSCVEDLYLDKGIIHQTEPEVANAEEFHYAVYHIASDISKQGEEPEVMLPEYELKPLPTHLKYEFLNCNKIFPVIMNASLAQDQTLELVELLMEYRDVIGYSIADIKGIDPELCNHRIYLEDGTKPSREHQRRLNPTLQEVVKKKY